MFRATFCKNVQAQLKYLVIFPDFYLRPAKKDKICLILAGKYDIF